VARESDAGRPDDTSHGAPAGACAGLPSHDSLRGSLVSARGQLNGGFGLDMWAAVVYRDGIVRAVAFNPVNPNAAYQGPASAFGQSDDPLVGRRIGGVNVFGGGLALYNARRELIGAIGVSGDTSCADHNIAWRARHGLGLDWIPAGVSVNKDDNINYQGLVPVPSLSDDFSHPICKIAGEDKVSPISAALPPTRQ
jgi:hypothetical protein